MGGIPRTVNKVKKMISTQITSSGCLHIWPHGAKMSGYVNDSCIGINFIVGGYTVASVCFPVEMVKEITIIDKGYIQKILTDD